MITRKGSLDVGMKQDSKKTQHLRLEQIHMCTHLDRMLLDLQIVEPNQRDSNTGEVIQTLENITNFIHAVQTMGLPSSSVFSVADIDANGWEERPRVVDCILTLKRCYEADQQGIAKTVGPRSPLRSYPSPAADAGLSHRWAFF